MNKKLRSVSIITLFWGTLFAQTGWFALNSGSSENLTSICFTDTYNGYAVGFNGVVLKTTNAGASWSSQVVSATEWIRCISFTDANTGYMASGNPSTYYAGNVYKTTNGGANWVPLSLPIYRHFYCVFFLNNSTGYVSGVLGTILKTTDAGSNWTYSLLTGLYHIQSVQFVNSNTGYAAESYGTGYTGNLLKTTNEGINWDVVYNYPGDGGFCSISFVDANTGVAVGGNGVVPASTNGIIYRTTNGGLNWTNINTYPSTLLWNVKFNSSGTGYAVGRNYSPVNGLVLKTTNSGMNWCNLNSNTTNFLSSCYFTNPNTGYITGYAGTLLKTTDGGGSCLVGIEPIKNEAPERFNLFQNYPNPFNPSTKIKFEVPKSEFILLKIYDNIGKEVSTLVNEYMTAGTYEVSWNAAEYSSGIYFYEMTSKEFHEVKKMILLK